jgi:hypothetical protein
LCALKAVNRRLAAILAADVVGYSRLMGADQEGTLERLKALRYELLDPKTPVIAAASLCRSETRQLSSLCEQNAFMASGGRVDRTLSIVVLSIVKR